MKNDNQYLSPMSSQDQQYIGSRPFIMLKPYNSNIDPNHFYSVVNNLVNIFPLFSSKAVLIDGSYFLKYEEKCFYFNIVESSNVSVLDFFSKSQYNTSVFDGLTDEFNSDIDQPLTGFTLTNFTNNKSILSVSMSHVLGDGETSKILAFAIAQLLSNHPITKIKAAIRFPFELEKDDSSKKAVGDWHEHSHHGHQPVRSGKIVVQNISLSDLEGIQKSYIGQNPGETCSRNIIVSTMLIKQTAKQLIAATDILNIKIPVDMRSRNASGRAAKGYIGNAYQSVLFSWAKQQIDGLTLEQLIAEVHNRINLASKGKSVVMSLTGLDRTDIFVNREYIISNVGNLSKLYMAFGEHSLGKVVTVGSDPFNFIIHRDRSGFVVQAFTLNE